MSGDSLRLAAARGDASELSAILAAGALGTGDALDAVDETGASAVYLCSRDGHHKCLKLLLEAGADANVTDAEGVSPIYTAAQEDQRACLSLLLHAGADADLPDNDGNTSIFIAAQEGHAECLRMLLEKGANPNKEMDEGATAVYVSSQEGHAECLALLLAFGAAVDQVDEDGHSPVFIASQENHIKCLTMLLHAGADASAANFRGTTPAFIASQEGHAECLKLLLDAKAEPNFVDVDGATPLYIAAQEGRVECLQLLLEAGADVDAADQKQVTPVFIACQNGHELCVDKLLRAGCDMTTPDVDGETPAFTCCLHGRSACLDRLLRAGADPNRARSDSWMPIHISAQEGHISCVARLLSSGADLQAQTESGLTALDLAQREQHSAIVDILRRPEYSVAALAREETEKMLQQAASWPALAVDTKELTHAIEAAKQINLPVLEATAKLEEARTLQGAISGAPGWESALEDVRNKLRGQEERHASLETGLKELSVKHLRELEASTAVRIESKHRHMKELAQAQTATADLAGQLLKANAEARELAMKVALLESQKSRLSDTLSKSSTRSVLESRKLSHEVHSGALLNGELELTQTPEYEADIELAASSNRNVAAHTPPQGNLAESRPLQTSQPSVVPEQEPAHVPRVEPTASYSGNEAVQTPLRGPPALASTGSVATDLPSRGHEGTAVVPGQQHLLPETQSRSVQPMVLKIDSDAELEELRMMLSSGPPSRRATPSSRQGATKEEMRAHDGAVLSPSKKIQVRL